MKVKNKKEGKPLWNKGYAEIILIPENNEDKKFLKFFLSLYEDVNEYIEISKDKNNNLEIKV